MRVMSTLRVRRELESWDEEEDRRQSEIREGLSNELNLKPGSRKYYIVRRGRAEYLAAYVRTAYSGARGAAYTIYMYDACRFKELIQAKRAALSLMESGEEWAVFILNTLNGDLQQVWKSKTEDGR